MAEKKVNVNEKTVSKKPAAEEKAAAKAVKTEKPAAKPVAKTEKPAAAAKSAAKTEKPAKKPVAKPVAKPVKDAPDMVYHISKRKEDRKWQVKAEGAAKALKLFWTQDEAIDYAKSVAGNQEGRIVIHKEDGSFRKLKY
ncbi:MAG: DUF2188 domain-containing protein [Clostridia bacterium]|nr:DUF2188 domain-containing protein [Clostridia bacterium]